MELKRFYPGLATACGACYLLTLLGTVALVLGLLKGSAQGATLGDIAAGSLTVLFAVLGGTLWVVRTVPGGRVPLAREDAGRAAATPGVPAEPGVAADRRGMTAFPVS